jgi:hypothetical protein
MTIEPRFKTYIVSTFAGYWLAFVASVVIVAAVESEMVVALIAVFFFSLFIAIGVSPYRQLLVICLLVIYKN